MALPMNLPGVIHYSDVGDRETTLLGVEIMWSRNELEQYPTEFGIFRTGKRVHVELLSLFEPASDTGSEECCCPNCEMYCPVHQHELWLEARKTP